ncbi:hypothetical protein BZG02_04000 [Labilibaculum filiforme]|uniref:CBM6 domain-containing protein n=1 Tax=Labilibaculum filiforme TaxID=1940526 RepID=A0A2N3I3X6_9BACT|nr:hypothetical protein [Labilibaculum filiforme]PKQ65008.1 hypothetical protein BZG02_04000 [Labilibaculum filiforme]
MLLSCINSFAQAWNYNNNRIAISADGNSAPDNLHKWPIGDPDDWGANAAMLAILAKLEMQDKLVHYSYNNFIDAPAGPDSRNQNKISCDGGIIRWHFDAEKFYDVTTQLEQATNSLAKEMTKSTADDPLYFLHAGLSEFVYLAVEKAIELGGLENLRYVKLVSHSGFNENHKRREWHHTWDDIQKLCGNRMQYHKIKDQNACNQPDVLWCSGKDFSPWYWMRDHKDESIHWLYTRVQAHNTGKADISDCGLLYWLLTGDESGNPEKFKNFIGDGIANSVQGIAVKKLIEDKGKDNFISMEAEHFDLHGQWAFKNDDLASGGRFIEYIGANNDQEITKENICESNFEIKEAGTYTVKWLMRQTKEIEGDRVGSVWINFPDAIQIGHEPVKGFHKFAGRGKNDFTMNGQLDLHGDQSWMTVKFEKAGFYTLQVSACSEFLQIDKFILYKDMSFEDAKKMANQ